MTTLSHPAIELALGALSGDGRAARLVAAIDRDDTVAVLVSTDSPFEGDDREARTIVFVEDDGTQWCLPEVINVAIYQQPARENATAPGRPIDAKYTKRSGRIDSDISWFGLSGYAAADAVAVTVISSLGADRVDVAADGLVLAAVRARKDEDPVIVIRLADGTDIVDAH